jgi:hypothetical protein
MLHERPWKYVTVTEELQALGDIAARRCYVRIYRNVLPPRIVS